MGAHQIPEEELPDQISEEPDAVTFAFTIRPIPNVARIWRERDSIAKLRKQLKDPDKKKRMEAWNFLQYRRRHGIR